MNSDSVKTMEYVVTTCCNIVSWHAYFFKKEIEMSKDKKIKLDMRDISKLVDPDIIIYAAYSEAICKNLKDILSNKGIYATIGEYNNGEKFLVLRTEEEKEEDIPIINKGIKNKKIKNKEIVNKEIDIETVIHNEEEKKNFRDTLKNNKLYNDDTKYLLCPECNRYSVEYSASSYYKDSKKWWCSRCTKKIIYHNYDIDISDKDKYHIYKLWGVDALSVLTSQSMKRTISFVGSYFKDCCVSKKDRCLYFDFFNEKDGKDGKDNVEGDVIDERSEMGIVRRNERSKQSDTVESSKLERG